MKFKIAHLLTVFMVLSVLVSCKKEQSASAKSETEITSFDSTLVAGFFSKHPDFKPFESEINQLYRKHDFHYIWYDKGGRIDFAEVLYNKVNQIKAEGIPTTIPYQNELDLLFDESENTKADLENELLISSLYFFYTKKVYEGLDPTKSKEIGWYLPREKSSYVNYLDSLLKDPKLIRKDESEMIRQYYNLKKALQFYRAIEKKGGWKKIVLPEGTKMIKLGDSAEAIVQVRKRLLISGDLRSDSKSAVLDKELLTAIAAYEVKHNIQPDNALTLDLVKHLNIPVQERIKTIIVNMERCRWISPEIAESKELIAVNIPSFRLQYFRDGKPILTSNVVVGKALHKTVIFSGQMSYLVFSPYWNIPTSILEKEIKPGIAANSNYLEQHDMEWNGPNVRQRPGIKNSLGLVKFMFPNSNNIYLHDSPAKSLFNRESRAFSHGCVRVQKARELAIKILENDKKWDAKKIDAAMNAGKEHTYSLKRKIPVYIAYFTAWADVDGKVSFYEDVYQRDNRLAHLLYNDK